jgi:hypothetical protein
VEWARVGPRRPRIDSPRSLNSRSSSLGGVTSVIEHGGFRFRHHGAEVVPPVQRGAAEARRADEGSSKVRLNFQVSGPGT